MQRRKNNKTWLPDVKTFQRKWWVVSADGVILGRLATRVAEVLMGKHRPTYTPFLDTGDFVIVTDAEKVRMTGEKLDQRFFQTYSGYKGGQKHIPLKDLFVRNPEEVIRRSVQHMLPKTTLGRHYIRKLHVYRGSKHPHAAQKPETLNLEQLRRGRIWLRPISGEPAAAKKP